MSKKNKKKRLKKSYNKRQFENILCSSCRVCCGYSNGPDFCYTLYKDNPDKFLDIVYKKLIVIDDWPPMVGQTFEGNQHTSNKLIEDAVFRNVFCKSGICSVSDDGDCPMLTDCLLAFRRQTGGLGKNHTYLPAEDKLPEERMTINLSNKKYKKQIRKEKREALKKARKKQKYICSAYPTFFTNDREDWIKQIEEILTHGDENIEQDKIVESSRKSEESDHTEANNSQSNLQ
jgi:hypothetical protein